MMIAAAFVTGVVVGAAGLFVFAVIKNEIDDPDYETRVAMREEASE